MTSTMCHFAFKPFDHTSMLFDEAFVSTFFEAIFHATEPIALVETPIL